MKTLARLLIGLIIVVILGAILYGSFLLTKKQNTIPPNALPDQTATSTDSGSASSTPAWTFATSSLDTSGWNTYSNPELGFSIAYPSNVIQSSDNASVTFVLPKTTYFHWPLEDDTKITVTASSTCPDFIGGADNVSATSTFMLNGHEFAYSKNVGVGAGNIYTEIVYDTIANGTCYRLSFFDHGANGAGLYVSDPSLIAQYDDQHTADMAAVLDLFNAMTGTFTVSH